MRIALKTEFAPAKLTAEQPRGCGDDNRQRNQLLPIHCGKITRKSGSATIVCIVTALFFVSFRKNRATGGEESCNAKEGLLRCVRGWRRPERVP